MAKHTNYDGVFKALPPLALFALLHKVLPDISSVVRHFPTEMRILPSRQIDGAYIILYQERQIMLHIEFQYALDLTMPVRMYHYGAMLKLKYFGKINLIVL